MEHVSSYLDLPLSQMEMKMVGHVQNSSAPQYFSVSNDQMAMREPVSSNSASEASMVPTGLGENNGSLGGSTSLNPMLMRSAENTSYPVKRKAEAGPLLPNSISQASPFPSKRPAHAGPEVNSAGFFHPAATDRKTTHVQAELISPGKQVQFLPNKKMVRNDSMAAKSAVQLGQNAKKQTARTISASKTHSGSSEAVRSKMRESLAAALELAFQNPDSVPNSQKDETNDSSATQLAPVDSKASESSSNVGDLGSGSEVLASKESAVADKTNDTQLLSADLIGNGSNISGGKIFEEFQFGSFLPDEDVPFGDTFFAKDDLLQGNGLSWAFEFDTQMREAKQNQDAENTIQPVKQEDNGHSDRSAEARLIPNDVADEIEAELFKLFGGVNKKYKEKGRSLLFNLKDHSNPELRERVMSGAISPERLCSMSAEELASKELSEWRMAKAEAYEQSVVLPDTDVNARRFVKKTHKGEYQVEEVERDDGIISEVSGGASMVTRHPPRKVTQVHPSPKESTKDKNVGQENGSLNQDVSGSLIIPTDGTDFMQGIIVDEIKDPALLPPIVSLDEFMESLNAEPPFENISPAAEGRNLPAQKDSPKATNNSHASDSPKYSSSIKADVSKREIGLPMNSTGISASLTVSTSSPKVEYFWQGKLQLNIGSSVTVGSLFQSGEKTSTKEWSTSLEIKGKVRIDAFEKFLQDLPMSRTRAVMVLLFVLKDKSSQDELSNLSEAVTSYVDEQRLGFAEPAAGVELYLCPPTTRMTDMLNKHLPKHTLPSNTTENELIGVVVWRRAQISNSISPNSSSHHKHSSKKQPLAPPKRAQDSPKTNANAPNRAHSLAKPQPETDDDDIPPGFGPVAAARAAKDDDDLPEFNFSGHVTRPVSHVVLPSNGPQRPVDQVRELIKKYGQSDTKATVSRNPVNNSSLNIQPWDDDDDDIPEWRPDAQPLQPRMYNPGLGGQRPPVHLLPSEHIVPPLPPPGSIQPNFGGRWPRPPGSLHGPRWRPY